jgi:NAD(P)-dependent dehydrogenase (short-subunit alcohol dehydrogenase family)
MRQFCTHFPGVEEMTIKTGFLTGKKLLITGVLSNRSIAYGIAKACHAQGAELAFSYVGERFKDRITEFAADFDSKLIFDCDVGSDEQIEQLFTDLSATWPKFDGFVHAIGYAPREAIAGDFLDGLSREGFKIAHDISAYSFPAMAKAALPERQIGRADPDVPRRDPHRAQLQHHGLGQSQPGSVGALPGRIVGQSKPWPARQRHFGWPHQDAGGQRHQGFWQDFVGGGRSLAHSPQRDH